jgi:hypothetical protein
MAADFLGRRLKFYRTATKLADRRALGALRMEGKVGGGLRDNPISLQALSDEYGVVFT